MVGCILRNQRHEVVGRLDALGLTEEILRDSVDAGAAPVLSCTLNDPAQLGGILGWGKITREFRDRVVTSPYNWGRANHRGQPSTVNVDGTVAVIVASGTPETGTLIEPATRSTKGPATKDAIATNWLTFAEIEPAFKKFDPPEPLGAPGQTWVLLYFIDEEAGEIRAELSLPESMDEDDYVTSWRERILLTSIPLDRASISIPDDDDEDVDQYEAPVSRLK